MADILQRASHTQITNTEGNTSTIKNNIHISVVGADSVFVLGCRNAMFPLDYTIMHSLSQAQKPL